MERDFWLLFLFPAGRRRPKKKKREDTSLSHIYIHARARAHSFTKKKSNDFIGRVAIQSHRRGICSKTREKDELGESVHDERWWWF